MQPEQLQIFGTMSKWTELSIAKMLTWLGRNPVRACEWRYDAAGNVIETHEHKGDFKEP